jgi:GT2 family glycosyltransferase
MGSSVSIVVPIFNGWNELKDCISSLKKYVSNNHKILLVNDCSTDDKIERNILSLIADSPNFVYFKNDENLGFVGTCNKSVSYYDTSDNDILLLNSDTEVTEGFLEEMVECLYSYERYAVVCPRSNNATILTVPYGHRLDDELKAYSIWNKIKQYLPRCSVIPTAVGFCMLIKRNIIKDFGLFDEVYSPGYNEENDFICRINRVGYSTIVSNHSFVFHKEGVSFSNRKNELERKNSKILCERYPEYLNKINDYEQYKVSPVDRFSILLNCNKIRIIYFINDLGPMYNGTSAVAIKYFQLLKDKMGDKYELFIYISKQAYDFFSEFKNEKNIIFCHEEINDVFHIAFKPYQIYSIFDMFLMHRIALKISFNLLDIISIRCDYLNTENRENNLKIACDYSDLVMSISDAAMNDYNEFYKDNLPKNTIYPYTLDNMPIDKKTTNSKKILIIGNHYDHKILGPTLHKLDDSLDITVLGPDLSLEFPNFEFLASGQLTPDQIDKIYESAKVIIYPSQYEGFGIPLVESNKYGKIIIVHNNSCMKEVSKKYGLKNVIFYETLNDLNTILESVDSIDVPSFSVNITWDNIGETLVQKLTTLAECAIDYDRILERNTQLKFLMSYANSSVVDRLNREINSYINSRSYRLGYFLTKPYRIIKFLLKKILITLKLI